MRRINYQKLVIALGLVFLGATADNSVVVVNGVKTLMEVYGDRTVHETEAPFRTANDAITEDGAHESP